MIQTAVATRIDELAARLRADDDSDDTRLVDFLRAYFAGAHWEHLRAYADDELLSIVRRHYRLAARRAPRACPVEVLEAAEVGNRRCSGVMTVAPDMPFLVDSVCMAVRDVGAGIGWVVHPVLRLRRDAGGGLTGVAGRAGAENRGDEESLIYVQCAALTARQRQALTERLRRVLADLQVVVADYEPLQARLDATVAELGALSGDAVDIGERDEAQAFLRWLADDHFMFLGYLERRIESNDGDEILVSVAQTGLGLLRTGLPGQDPDGYVAPAGRIDKYAQSSRLLIVTQANARSWLHSAEFMDVVAVKRVDVRGRIVGAHRFLGLFAGDAYAAHPRQIPVLRRKIRDVVARAGLRPGSHNAKTLRYILDTFPRDELFQSSEDELYDTAMGVLATRESQRLRLFIRRDRYHRFYACMVYIPRERGSQSLHRRVGALLAEMLGGEERESSSEFLRGGLVRSHYIITVASGSDREYDHDAIEARLLAATRTWLDDFRAALEAYDDPLIAEHLEEKYAEAFPSGYSDRIDGAEVLDDAEVLERLNGARAPVIRLLPAIGDTLRLKLYGRGAAPGLAEVLPLLENFGLRVRTQRPYRVHPRDDAASWIHEFEAGHRQVDCLRQADARTRVAQAFAQIWRGSAENDGLNRLIVAAGLDWRRVALLRCMTRYLLQTRLPFSQGYVETLLAGQPQLVAAIVDAFYARFDPAAADHAERSQAALTAVEQGLNRVASLDGDRALRALLAVVRAGLRTNYFQPGADGDPKPYISIKLDPTHLPELPDPRPMFEAFVYAPQVEGIHLRGGKVARGGLRWSDRREDFRTEVLGLMKAQMVKNAVIVPVGAKGGFVLKNAPDFEDREARRQRGIAAYKTFVSGLLDITDNHRHGEVVPPRDVVRHDGDDPYLVVAADKGTASFSDIANGIARDYDYWLDDAFASGGSAGYDHKAIGITARGAWEGVKRHFREMGRDIQAEDFTVVGIGDMGGDVFGNGMLLSPHIRLLAAFNHRHIFIDPSPDAAASFAERQRLFAASACGWDAYDKSVISAGGGVFERSEKVIELSDEARNVLAIEQTRFSPNELIHELLRAPVDLLWNGGIGTYVKARTQSHLAVGDRANDALRVDARELRCQAIGEGGNLGLTQAGRIEFARNGGRLNTDAIDNSGGVDSSDLEVNIKIALGTAQATGRLTRDARNQLLASMTDDVAALVLRTNYLQTQLISVLESDAPARLDEYVNFIRALERDGVLNRAIEGLPDEEGIEERLRNGEGLTRPELAVLVSYAKMTLFSDVLASDLLDEPLLEQTLLDGFPPRMRVEHADDVRRHRLRREIIATLVTNQLVDRMGATLVHRMAAETGVPRHRVVRAFVLATDAFDMEGLCRQIEALDNRLPAAAQYRLLQRVAGLVKHAVGWLIARGEPGESMAGWVEHHREATRELLARLPEFLIGGYREAYEQALQEMSDQGVPAALAERLAAVQRAGGALDILALARADGVALDTVARLYFRVGDWLGLSWLQNAIAALEARGRWEALARASLREECYRAHGRIVAAALACPGEDAADQLQAWQLQRADAVDFVRQRLADLQAGETPRFAHLAVAVRDLARLGASTSRP